MVIVHICINIFKRRYGFRSLGFGKPHKKKNRQQW